MGNAGCASRGRRDDLGEDDGGRVGTWSEAERQRGLLLFNGAVKVADISVYLK